jgi:hypothetical protein
MMRTLPTGELDLRARHLAKPVPTYLNLINQWLDK